MVKWRAVSVLAGLGLVLSGCAVASEDGAGSGVSSVGSGSDGSGAGGPNAGAGDAAARAVLAGTTTVDGAAFDVASVADRPVVLWFWAPWCTICRGEAPDVAEVAAELRASGSDVVLLGVPGRGEVPAMQDFVTDTDTGDITHVVDEDGSLWRHFGVLTQPAFAFLDGDGGVHVVNGALGEKALREAVDELELG